MRYAILTLVLTLGGCESVTENLIEAATGTEIERDGETVTLKTRDGEITTTTSDKDVVRVQTKDGTVEIGGTEVPKDFPLPVPDGAKILSSARMTKDGVGFQVSFTSEKSATALAQMYQEAIEKKGLKVKRNDMKMDANTMINLSAKDEKKLRVSAAFIQEAGGTTQAMLSWQN